MEKTRPAIREVLRTEFGGDSFLFVSLWNAVEYWRNEDSEPPPVKESIPEGIESGAIEIDWSDDATRAAGARHDSNQLR